MISEGSILQLRFKLEADAMALQHGLVTGPVNHEPFQSTGTRIGILKRDDCTVFVGDSIDKVKFCVSCLLMPINEGEHAWMPATVSLMKPLGNGGACQVDSDGEFNMDKDSETSQNQYYKQELSASGIVERILPLCVGVSCPVLYVIVFVYAL
jgi:hypothetical protein